MRRIFTLYAIFLLWNATAAASVDSLKRVLAKQKEDTTMLYVLNQLVEAIDDDDVWPGYNRKMYSLSHRLALSPSPAIAKRAKWYKATALNNMNFEYEYKGQPDKSIESLRKSIAIWREIKDKAGLASALNNLAFLYQRNGRQDEALKMNQESLKLYRQCQNHEAVANVLNNIGYIELNRGLVHLAIEKFHESLAIREKIKDMPGVSTSLNNLAYIYQQNNDYEEAHKCYNRAMAIDKSLGNEEHTGMLLTNIGSLYALEQNYTKAIECHREAIRIKKKYKAIRLLGDSYSGLASVFRLTGKTDSAVAYYAQSIDVFTSIDDKRSLAASYIKLAETLHGMKQEQQALDYAENAYALAYKGQYMGTLINSALFLSNAEKKRNNTKEALHYLGVYVRMRDSLIKEENKDAVIKSKYQYAYKRKQISDSISLAKFKETNEAIIKRKEAEAEQRKTQSYFLFTGLALTLILLVVAIRAFLNKKRSNRIITLQKEEVEKQRQQVLNQKIILEEKNKEITDSINYARRLQDAIIPGIDTLKRSFPESFVVYKPKEIVAGDFYWLHHVKNGDNTPQDENGEAVLFAVADCTGHGVPGAMVSVVGANGLHRCVNEFKLTRPAHILDKLTVLVEETFDKKGSEVRDGMDISLCSIRYPGNANPRQPIALSWSGANNGLWIIRPEEPVEELPANMRVNLSHNGFMLMELRPDKQPIGRYEKRAPFRQLDIELKPGDQLIFYTDGYADQFGGEKGKKLKNANLQKLLLSCAAYSISELGEFLDTTFEKWRGEFEQTDDVCIIGIRV